MAKVSQKVDMTQEKANKPKAVSETEVEIPSKGIHKTVLKEGENVELLGSPEIFDGQDFTNSGDRRSGRTSENGVGIEMKARNKIKNYSTV